MIRTLVNSLLALGAFALSASSHAQTFEMKSSVIGLRVVDAAAQITTTPWVVPFGDQRVQTASESRSLTLTNVSSEPVSVATVRVPTAVSSLFQLDSGDCEKVLAPQATCELQVAFSPRAMASTSADLLVELEDGSTLTAGKLQGRGVQGSPVWSTQNMNFSGLTVGAPVTQTLKLLNAGSGSFDIKSIGLTGDTAFTLVEHSCGTSLAPGSDCAVTLRASAPDLTQRTGAVVLSAAGAPTYNYRVQLSMRPQANEAALSWSPAAATLPSTNVGQRSTVILKLQSVGTVPAVVTGYEFVGNNDDQFQLVDPTQCLGSLNPGMECAVEVAAAPRNSAAVSVQLAVQANTATPTSPATLSLTGLWPSLEVRSAVSGLRTSSMAFPNAAVGSAGATQAFLLTNVGTGVLTFSQLGLAAGSTDFTQSNDCTSLSAGASCTVSVTFAPTAAVSRTGALQLAYVGAGYRSLSLYGVGEGSSATLSDVSFAPQTTGTSVNGTATLRNAGVAALNLTVPSASSVSGTGFSFVSTTCGASLAPQATCNIVVAFTPDAGTVFSGALSVSTDAGVRRSVLTGSGRQGVLRVSPSTLSFPATQLGVTASTLPVTLSNTGTAPLTVTGLSVVTGTGDFSQSNNCASLAVNASCTVNVSFTPAMAGARTGALGIVSSAGSSTVGLSGSGVAASASVFALDFGRVTIGTAPTGTVTLRNNGLVALQVTAPTQASISADEFYLQSTTCGGSLAANASCTATVQFSPSSVGTKSAALTFQTGSGSVAAALSAEAVQGVLVVNPSQLTFGMTAVGSTSAVQAITLTNTGNATVVIDGISVLAGEGYSPDFGQSNNCAQIAAGSSCTINVAFTPAVSGTRTATVGIAHNGGGASTVALTGAAFLPPLPDLAFGSLAVGSTAELTATLSNTTSTTMWLQSPNPVSVAGLNFSLVSTTCGFALDAGSSCSATVRFTPTASGSATGQLAFNLAYNRGAFTAALTGSATQGLVSLSTGSVVFGSTILGSTSGTQTVTVTNTGNGPLSMSGISVVQGAADFAQSNNCAAVAVGGSCTINLTFTPAALGTRTGTLGLVHNGGGVSVVSLQGTGEGASVASADGYSCSVYAPYDIGTMDVEGNIVVDDPEFTGSYVVTIRGPNAQTEFAAPTDTFDSQPIAGSPMMVGEEWGLPADQVLAVSPTKTPHAVASGVPLKFTGATGKTATCYYNVVQSFDTASDDVSAFSTSPDTGPEAGGNTVTLTATEGVFRLGAQGQKPSVFLLSDAGTYAVPSANVSLVDATHLSVVMPSAAQVGVPVDQQWGAYVSVAVLNHGSRSYGYSDYDYMPDNPWQPSVLTAAEIVQLVPISTGGTVDIIATGGQFGLGPNGEPPFVATEMGTLPLPASAVTVIDSTRLRVTLPAPVNAGNAGTRGEWITVVNYGQDPGSQAVNVSVWYGPTDYTCALEQRYYSTNGTAQSTGASYWVATVTGPDAAGYFGQSAQISTSANSNLTDMASSLVWSSTSPYYRLLPAGTVLSSSSVRFTLPTRAPLTQGTHILTVMGIVAASGATQVAQCIYVVR